MRYELAEDVLLEEADGTQVMLRDNGDAAVLNPTAGIVVSRLLEAGVDACVGDLVSRYDVEPSVATADVAAFVDELVSHVLIKECM